MPVVLRGVDEVLGAVGRHFGYSDGLVVGVERVAQFESATGAAEAAGDDHAFLPANLILSLSNFFLPQIVAVEGVSAGINYGADQVRFLQPAPAGSTLRAGAQLLAAHPIEGGVQTTIRITLEVVGAEAPVCVIDSLSRFLA